MKITTESLENRQLRMTIEVDEEQTQAAMRRAARYIAKQVNVPGFRKGKAPYSAILQRFGEETVRQQAADTLAEEVYAKALDQEEIDPYAAGTLDSIEYDPITLTFTIPLMPEITLGDYRDYRPDYEEPEISEDDVQTTLENIREENTMFESVERPAEMGDGVVIDLRAQSDDEVELLKGDDIHLILEPDNADPAPGFAEALVGLKAGEEKTFRLTLTDAFPQEEYRGKEAEFNVTVKEVYDSTMPDLNDDLARTVGNFDSLEELKQSIREQMLTEVKARVDTEYTEKIVKNIVDASQVDYPPVMLQSQIAGLLQELERSLKRDAKLSIEDYLRLQGKTLEELRLELEPDAALSLKRALVLGEIVRVEKLDVESDEIDAHIDEMSAPWGVRAEEIRTSLNSDQGREAMRSRLMANKAVQFLVASAKGESEAVESEEDLVAAEAESTDAQAEHIEAETEPVTPEAEPIENEETEADTNQE